MHSVFISAAFSILELKLFTDGRNNPNLGHVCRCHQCIRMNFTEIGVKDFYSDLHNILQQVDSRAKRLSLGDFYARVGRYFEL